MNKSILIVALFLAIAFGCSSFWFGKKTEETYYRLLDQGRTNSPLVITSESYLRGWFTSTARTRVEIPRPGKESVRLVLEHTLRHGPFPLGRSADGQLQFSPLLAFIETRLLDEGNDWLSPELATREDLASAQSGTSIRLDGSGYGWFSVPTLHQRSSEANACTSVWEGLLGTGTFSADGTEGTGTVRADSLRVSVPEGDLLMTELESNLRVTAPPSELTRGEGDFSVARVAWGDETLTLDGLQGRFRGTVEDETAAYALTLGLDELKTRGESFGPVGLDLELRRLDVAALLRLQTLLEELQPAFLTEPAETIGRQVVLRSGALLPQLFRRSPELELHHLIIKTGQGDFFAKGKLVIGDGEPGETFSLPASLVNVRAEGEIDADEALTENLLSFLVRTRLFDTALAGPPEGRTTAELEAATAEESRKELEVLVRKGLLTRDSNGYHLLFAYGKGQATLNGKPFPPR